MSKLVDLTGKEFGFLRVIRKATKEEAVEARINKEKELFGDYSFFNRPDSNFKRDTWLGDMLKEGLDE